MGLMSSLDLSSVFHRAAADFDIAAWRARMRVATAHGLPLLKEICDPRGRCDRRGFLVIALTFLILQVSVAAFFWLFTIEPSQTVALLLNAPVIWIGTAVCFKRLHDVGLSGWWLPGAFAIWLTAAMIITTIIAIVVGDDALQPGQLGFMAVFALVTIPAFGALLWLHTAPSMTVANRFGPVTGQNGLSMPMSASI